jgi:CRISPR/Cas system-associated exonuclease Cas4 (RecB family)
MAAISISFVLARLRRRTGFAFTATGRSAVIASDVGTERSIILRDPIHGIRGKPDYLIESEVGGRRVLVPLEVKPTRRSRTLYDSDRVQIGAYLMALRGTFPDRASDVGYVRYADHTFVVRLTPELAQEVERIAAAVRRGRRAVVLRRSHNISGRCRACPMRYECADALPG